jgi:hypothetical protein
LTVPCLAQQQRKLLPGETPVPEGQYVPAPTSNANPASNLGVVPAAARTAFGNSNNNFPFSSLPMRYQQVNLGSDLPASHRIIGLGLRQDQSFSGYTGATIDVEMKVGYTTFSDTTLTTTFDSNFNAGAPLPVLPRTNVVMPQMRPTLPTDPNVFFFQVPWRIPFPWVQQAGRNILIEIVVHGNDRYTSFTYPLDAQSLASAGTGARLYNSGFPTAPFGTLGLNFALVLNYLDVLQTAADYSYYGTGCKGTGGFAGDIVPKYFGGAMGGSTNTIPWSSTNYRFQQVFLGSELPIPAAYTALHLRPGSSTYTGGNWALEVYFGYTTYNETTMTTNFSSNMDSGPLTQVYNSTVSFPPITPNTDPQNFNQISIPFSAPWAYIPAAGKNVLMEVLNKNTTAVSYAVDNCSGAPNATTSRLYASGLTAVTGSKTTNYGIVIGLAKAGNGSATPSLTATGLPIIGQPITVKLSAARKLSAAICPLGTSNTLWGALPLPFDMTVVGAPGCFLRASLDGLIIGGATDANGNAQFTLPIPNAIGLSGVVFYNQWIVFDAPANTLGLVLTNGGKATIGEF